jgi:hypothetical protein
MLSPSSK